MVKLLMWGFIFLSLITNICAQNDNPCGWNYQGKENEILQAPGFGYSYDSLLIDLQKWSTNPFVGIDSAGLSVQGRTLWLLTIQDTVSSILPQWRVTIHARTHPQEVQSTWITNSIIDLLLSDSLIAQKLRRTCIFNILPMYNPDGVELGYNRVNANMIDLERNWDDVIQEPEAATLKRLFESYMNSDIPVRIALNMHSSSDCERFFVFHHETGTSVYFAEDQKQFIKAIRDYWPEGIQDWNYFVSWQDETPPYYPESWFWLNYGEQVMALTYEDMYCSAAGEFNRTAHAILSGIADYLNINTLKYDDRKQSKPRELSAKIFPNPASSHSSLSIQLQNGNMNQTKIVLYDIVGRKILEQNYGNFTPNTKIIHLKFPRLAAGIYYVQIKNGWSFKTVPLYIIK